MPASPSGRDSYRAGIVSESETIPAQIHGGNRTRCAIVRPAMGRRGLVTLATTIAFATTSACAADSSTSDPAPARPRSGPRRPPVDVGSTTPAAVEVEAIVSAAGGGGLIDGVEVTGLEVLGAAGGRATVAAIRSRAELLLR